jgi:hypothetical protein
VVHIFLNKAQVILICLFHFGQGQYRKLTLLRVAPISSCRSLEMLLRISPASAAG